MERDHYRVLGVGRFAAAADVRRAYIALIKSHYGVGPRRALSDDGLRRVSEAYWVLRHPIRRAAYDFRLKRSDRRPVAGRTVRPRLPPPRPARRTANPARRTRALFLAMLAVLATGIGWAVHNRPPGERVAAADRMDRSAQSMLDSNLHVTAISAAFADYRMLRAGRDRSLLIVRIRKCFVDLHRELTATLFDYCSALDGLGAAAAIPGPDDFFGDDARRARIARVAFERPGDALPRWEAINRVVAQQLWLDVRDGATSIRER